MNPVGLKIKELRKSMRISQEKFSEVLGVTPGAVCKWETGLTNPDIDLLVDIAEFFNVSLDYLFDHTVNNNSLDVFIKRLREASDKKEFLVGLDEISQMFFKYKNSFLLSYNSAEYLYYFAIESKNREIFDRALEYYQMSLILFSQNEDKKIAYGAIHEKMMYIYLNTGRWKEAKELVENSEFISNKNFCLGQIYYFLRDNKNSLSNMSLSMLDAARQLCVCGYYMGLVQFETRRYDDGIKLCNMIISTFENLSKNSFSCYKPTISNFYLRKAIFEFMLHKPEYVNTIKQSVYVLEEYKKNPDFTTDSVNFYYGEKETFYSATDNMDEENDHLIKRAITTEKSVEEFKKVFEEIRGY